MEALAPSRSYLDGIGSAVRSMYMHYPYPMLTRQERHRQLAGELCRYRYLGLEAAMKGARVLDVGCGTGDRTILAAKHLGVEALVGFDGSTASLKRACEVAEEEEFHHRFDAVNGNLFSLPFPDASFDIVVSWGVLHHTSDPVRGFREMVRVCRPGGHVALFLYNRWNHWRHNLQKSKVTRLGGDDIEKRFDIAHRLYGKKPVERMTPSEIATFYDQYCHPHKSDHTIEQTLEWFASNRLEYTGSYPPLRPADFVQCAQFRGSFVSDCPFEEPMTRRVAKAVNLLPQRRTVPQQFRRPTRAHTVFAQLVLAWMGRHGEYSGGPAMAARKPR